MKQRTKQIVATALVAVSVSGMAAVLAQPAPGDAPPAAVQPAATAATVKGIVRGMNLSADGEPNGLLLKTGDGPLTQLNFPPHMAAAIAKVVKPGTGVTATTRPLPPGPPRPENDGRPAPPPPPAAPPADHPVAELTGLTPDGGEEVKVVRPEEMPTKHVDGKIARLNYAREGQIDGAVLEDGTFVHVGPKEAETLKLAVGQTLSVDGVKPPKGGDTVLHATKVNGTAIERPRPGPGGPKGPPTPPAP